jgi:hypothetical protein
MTTLADVIDHEAAHASCAALLGLPLLGVEVDTLGGGCTRVLYADADLAQRVKVIIAGMIQSGDAPPWPPRTDQTTDERNLHRLVKQIGLDGRDYRRLVNETEALAASPKFKILRATIAAMVEHHGGALSGPQLRRLIGDALVSEATLDEELADIEAHAAARQPTRYKATSSFDHDDALWKALGEANARALRAHRLANERVEIKTFPVG